MPLHFLLPSFNFEHSFDVVEASRASPRRFNLQHRSLFGHLHPPRFRAVYLAGIIRPRPSVHATAMLRYIRSDARKEEALAQEILRTRGGKPRDDRPLKSVRFPFRSARISNFPRSRLARSLAVFSPRSSGMRNFIRPVAAILQHGSCKQECIVSIRSQRRKKGGG